MHIFKIDQYTYVHILENDQHAYTPTIGIYIYSWVFVYPSMNWVTGASQLQPFCLFCNEPF